MMDQPNSLNPGDRVLFLYNDSKVDESGKRWFCDTKKRFKGTIRWATDNVMLVNVKLFDVKKL